ncbi:replicative DNA helicase [Gammaproteobacteria bacterium]|nr:replicative DNA helicase [Gammaproteobacteria bacterium]
MDKITDLESNIIGSMILEGDQFHKAQESGLMPDDFEYRSYREIYQSMIEANSADIVTLTTKIRNPMVIQDAKDSAINCISSAGFESWLRLMFDKTANNKLRNLATLIPEIVDEKGPIENKIDQINSILVENKITKNFGSPLVIADVMKSVKEEISNAKMMSKNLIPTGFDNIDKKIHGFKRGDLIIVAGRPGMGKTTWALNIAANNINKDKTVLVFSLEMTNEQLVKKIISAESDLSMDKLMTGNLTDDDWKKFNKVESDMSQKNFYVYDKSPITIETLINKAKTVQAVKNIDLIVVDYLQLLMTSSKAPANADSRAASMSYISNLLKGLAKDAGCPVIAVSQLNRGVEARVDKRPILSDLRDSGSIEQDADMVFMLYRQEYYDSLDSGMAEIICRKNRMGESGTFELGFDGALSKFVNSEDIAFGKRKNDFGPI